MKILTACVVYCIVLIVLMAGCASKPAPIPSPPDTNAVPATMDLAPEPVRVLGPSLVGTWYLAMIP